MDDPILYESDFFDYSDEDAEMVSSEIAFACFVDRDSPDAAFESVSDLEFDEMMFDDFIAEYIANESISTDWGKLINYEKEIKMAGNAMVKAAGSGINLLPGTDGFTTSAPRKKDGQYYTRATFAFSDGQAVRILFYNPDDPKEKHRYPSGVVSFQIFLNKKDITPHLIKGGGKDYGPQKFGKIIGNLVKKNSDRFQKKNAEIRAQKEEMDAIDKEITDLDKQIAGKADEAKQSQEQSVFLKKQHADWKQKSETASAAKAEKIRKASIVSAKNEAYELGKQAFHEGINDPKRDERLLNYQSSIIGDSRLLKITDEEWQKGWDSARIKSEAEAEIDESMEETEAGKSWMEGTHQNFEGKKYDKELSIKDVAKVVRGDLKKARTSGEILDAGGQTYSVRSERNSININLMDIPEGVDLYSEKWKEAIRNDTQRSLRAMDRFSDVVKDTLDKIEVMLKQYQKYEKDSMTDYFNFSFYDTVEVDWALINRETERVKSEVETGGEVETTESADELKKLLIAEYGHLKADPDTPDFKMGIRVGKKKGGLAGKVTLDIKSVDEIVTKEGLDELKSKIEAIVSAHTDNYSISSDKAKMIIEMATADYPIDEAILSSRPGLKGKSHQQLKDEGAADALDSIISSYIAGIRNALFDRGFEKKGNVAWPLTKGSGTLNARFISEEGVNNIDATLIANIEGKETPFPIELSAPPEVLADRIDRLFLDEAEQPQQEQVQDTDIKPSEIPPEEQPPAGREIGQDYKDRDGTTKTVTHEIDGKKVSAIEQRGYIISAYLRDRKWVNLPTEEKTLISEDDLKKAIDRSGRAYDIADDILTGKYDADGPDKVDQLLDEVAEDIEDETKLNQIADYLTNLLAKKFAPIPA